MLSLEVGVRTFMPHPSAGPKKASFLYKPKTAVLPVDPGSTPQWRTMVLAAADPLGSVGLVDGGVSVKSLGSALGKILRRPAQTAIAAGSVVLWVKKRVLRRARVALLSPATGLRGLLLKRERGLVRRPMSSPLQQQQRPSRRRQERPLRPAV